MKPGRSVLRWKRWLLSGVISIVAVGLVMPASAEAFDTAPHFDITGDALSAEGFGRDAQRVARSTTGSTTSTSTRRDVPQSGHAVVVARAPRSRTGSSARSRAGPRRHQGGKRHALRLEQRRHGLPTRAGPREGVEPASRHDDQDVRYGRPAERAARVPHRARREPPRGAGLLRAYQLGRAGVRRAPGSRRARLARPRARLGAHLVRPLARERDPKISRTYTNGTPKGKVDKSDKLFGRGHGSWRSDNNVNLATKMNKDWPGRPFFAQAYMAGYFASRQWVQAVRRVVNAPAFWAAVRSYRPARPRSGRRSTSRSARARTGRRTGRVTGRGRASRSAPTIPARAAASTTSSPRPRRTSSATGRAIASSTSNVVPRLRLMPAAVRHLRRPVDPHDAAADAVRPRSRPEDDESGRGRHRPRRGRLLRDGARSTAGGSSPASSTATTRSRSGGRTTRSRSSGRCRPGRRIHAPLTELRVEIRTSRTNGAGTDDNVYLRINDAQRFQLDNRLHDDFERGDVSTYSLPVDTTAPFDRASLGHLLRRDQVPPDREVEGRRLGRMAARWHHGVRERPCDLPQRGGSSDGSAGATARGASRTSRRPPPTSQLVPVWLTLFDADRLIYGDDDHADINPDLPPAEPRARVRARAPSSSGRPRAAADTRRRSSSTATGPTIRYLIDTMATTPPPAPPLPLHRRLRLRRLPHPHPRLHHLRRPHLRRHRPHRRRAARPPRPGFRPAQITVRTGAPATPGRFR